MKVNEGESELMEKVEELIEKAEVMLIKQKDFS